MNRHTFGRIPSPGTTLVGLIPLCVAARKAFSCSLCVSHCLRGPLLFPQSPTDAKHMPVRVPQMHLAHVPRHVHRRKSDIQPCRHALFVNRVHVLHPNGHPDALIRRLVALRPERSNVCSSTAASLATLAKKNLA